MPKPEILDPQGKAVTGALSRLGFNGVSVRQGKRFELEVEGDLTDDRLAEVHKAAETLLANTVIETFVRVERASGLPRSASSPSRDRWMIMMRCGLSGSPAPSRCRCGTAAIP